MTRRTGVLPQLKLVKYDCAKCEAVIGPFTQDYGESEVKVLSPQSLFCLNNEKLNCTNDIAADWFLPRMSIAGALFN